MNPFLPLLKQIVNQMGITKKIPETHYELLGEQLLQRIWSKLEPNAKDSYEIFYPLMQTALYDVCEHRDILKQINGDITSYLINTEKRLNHER